MNARDELAEVIKPAAAYDFWPQKAAELAIEAGYFKPRTITTEEELDALPAFSVVLDEDGDVWQKRAEEWCSYETARSSSKRVAKYQPLTVLHEGTKP